MALLYRHHGHLCHRRGGQGGGANGHYCYPKGQWHVTTCRIGDGSMVMSALQFQQTVGDAVKAMRLVLGSVPSVYWRCSWGHLGYWLGEHLTIQCLAQSVSTLFHHTLAKHNLSWRTRTSARNKWSLAYR